MDLPWPCRRDDAPLCLITFSSMPVPRRTLLRGGPSVSTAQRCGGRSYRGDTKSNARLNWWCQIWETIGAYGCCWLTHSPWSQLQWSLNEFEHSTCNWCLKAQQLVNAVLVPSHAIHSRMAHPVPSEAIIPSGSSCRHCPQVDQGRVWGPPWPISASPFGPQESKFHVRVMYVGRIEQGWLGSSEE